MPLAEALMRRDADGTCMRVRASNSLPASFSSWSAMQAIIEKSASDVRFCWAQEAFDRRSRSAQMK